MHWPVRISEGKAQGREPGSYRDIKALHALNSMGRLELDYVSRARSSEDTSPEATILTPAFRKQGTGIVEVAIEMGL